MTDRATTQRDFALDVVRQLRAAGYQALWAGGCVRDRLLGRAPTDYDVAASATPDQVRQLFGHRRTLAIGAAFGVVAVLGGRSRDPIEVATFRTDGKYLDGRHPDEVVFSDAEHDALRRDFTINGLFFDPLEEQVIDYVDGQRDLDAGVVRAIGDPRQRFSEDKLRMLRAVRFATVLQFQLDPATLAAVQEMAAQVTDVSAERIGAELGRILQQRHRRRGLELLLQSNLLTVLFPELSSVSADASAWQTKLAALDRLEGDSLAVAMALLLEGVVPADKSKTICRRLRWTNKVADRAAWLLLHLDDARTAATLTWPRLQRLLVHDGAHDLVAALSACVAKDDAGLVRCRQKLALSREQLDPPPLATGDDLVAAGFPPGRYFAELLEHLRDQQLEGRLTAQQEALAEARRWRQSHS